VGVWLVTTKTVAGVPAGVRLAATVADADDARLAEAVGETETEGLGLAILSIWQHPSKIALMGSSASPRRSPSIRAVHAFSDIAGASSGSPLYHAAICPVGDSSHCMLAPEMNRQLGSSRLCCPVVAALSCCWYRQ
jgi:hypothetical protein